jgi:hypothetical protein
MLCHVALFVWVRSVFDRLLSQMPVVTQESGKEAVVDDLAWRTFSTVSGVGTGATAALRAVLPECV